MANSVKKFALSDEELKSFHENGFIGPITVYEPEEMRAMWKEVRVELLDRTNAVYPDESLSETGSTNIANYDRHLDIDALSRHICNARIVDRVSSILGPDVLCWRTEFFPKYPGDEGTDWHQADTFANASGTPQIVWPKEANGFGGTITVWTAFTESTLENGCLQLMPGTHTTMYYDESKGMEYDSENINSKEKDKIKRGFFGYDYRQLQVDPDWSPDESKAFPLVMEPGQCVIFWSTLMHASLPHSGMTNDMRMGFAARYIPKEVNVYPDTEFVVEYGGKIPLDNYGSVLVSGQDDTHLNKLLSRNRRGTSFADLIAEQQA